MQEAYKTMTQQAANNNSILRDAREAKGLTLEIVHEATKIPMDALKAIEQGYSTRILTPFYYKGFIKIYAEFLGLNVEEILKEYKVSQSMAPKVVTANNPIKKSVKAHKPIQVIEKGQHVITGLNNRKNRDLFSKIMVGVAIIVALVIVFKFIVPNIKMPKFPKKEQKQEKVKIAAEAVEVKETKGTKEKLPFKLIRAESSNLKVALSVRAVKDSWIQVKVDGKVAYAMNINKGTMENWVAYNQIELSGRNIHELDLEVNGKHLGALGSAERGVRKAVITRQGLTVKK